MKIFSFLNRNPRRCSNYSEAFMRSQRLYDRLSYKKAELWARRGLELRPDDSDGRMQLARALLFQDKYEEALAEVDKVIESGDYDYGDAIFWKGRILYEGHPYAGDRSKILARLYAAVDCFEEAREFLGNDKAVEIFLQKAHEMIRSLSW